MPSVDENATSKRRATIKDVAEAAAVSRSTASRALTGHGYVAADARKRVLAAARRLQYVPDATARQLKQQTSRTIGVVVSDLRNSFYSDLAAGAAQKAREAGYTMILADDDGVAGVRAMLEMRVAGIVLTPSDGEGTSFVLGHGVPIVEVDRTFMPGRADSVVLDNRSLAREIASNLLERGHRRIVLLIDETDWTTGRDRLAGFRDAYADAGVDTAESEIVATGWSATDAAAAVGQVLAGDRRPTAIFAANNVLAEGAYRAVRDAGLTIPGDVSLVSFDDAPWMSMVHPGVTAVAQDAAVLGATAVEQLLGRIDSPGQPVRSIMLSAEVVRRGSVGAPRA